jgi:hypothetical protein
LWLKREGRGFESRRPPSLKLLHLQGKLEVKEGYWPLHLARLSPVAINRMVGVPMLV